MLKKDVNQTKSNDFSLFDPSGVYRADTEGPSPPDVRPFVVAGSNKRRSGAPGWDADKRGHYRDQHRPEESDPDLLLDEGHNNSTQIVVKLFSVQEILQMKKHVENYCLCLKIISQQCLW